MEIDIWWGIYFNCLNLAFNLCHFLLSQSYITYASYYMQSPKFGVWTSDNFIPYLGQNQMVANSGDEMRVLVMKRLLQITSSQDTVDRQTENGNNFLMIEFRKWTGSEIFSFHAHDLQCKWQEVSLKLMWFSLYIELSNRQRIWRFSGVTTDSVIRILQ